jgi:hypothetical protein
MILDWAALQRIAFATKRMHVAASSSSTIVLSLCMPTAILARRSIGFNPP